ncbi:MAG: signal peptidase I [Psychroserpens sp.]|jgi:signal peptidase I|uniref:signal peptidase I n=1 Tax=Psychroserpens sp. TaxID=2020870 RepID=UPI0039E47B2F
MKKKFTYILVFFLVVFGIARISGMLSYYNIASTGTEPNLKLNDHFVGSNLITPKRLDFAYYSSFNEALGKLIVIQRIMAMPNDVVKCVDGRFFVNDIDVDDTLNLRYSYKLSLEDYKTTIKNDFVNDGSFFTYSLSADSIVAFLDEVYVENLSINLKRSMSADPLSLAKDIASKSHNWTVNNFGPLTIPERKYFFVGDNRDNSLDSRYNRLVDENDIKGALLFQF